MPRNDLKLVRKYTAEDNVLYYNFWRSSREYRLSAYGNVDKEKQKKRREAQERAKHNEKVKLSMQQFTDRNK